MKEKFLKYSIAVTSLIRLVVYLVCLAVFEIWMGLLFVVLWNGEGELFDIRIFLHR